MKLSLKETSADNRGYTYMHAYGYVVDCGE